MYLCIIDTTVQKFGHTCFVFIFATSYTADTHWIHQIFEEEMWINVAKEKNNLNVLFSVNLYMKGGYCRSSKI